MENLSCITRALHTRVSIADAEPSVTPIFQNSAFESTSPYFYTRKSNPNSVELETVVKTLEGCKHAVSTTTGMSALSLVLNLLRPGDTLVVNKDIYGCSYKLFQRISKQRNINLLILDLSVEDQISEIPQDVTMVLFETPTNPFLKTVSINKVSKRAKENNPDALVVVDNTWATPLFQKPIQLGADISLYSCTKYFAGHSDVMGGIILMDRDDLASDLSDERFYTGAILEPHSAWLIRRSLQTLPLRLAEHQKVTTLMSEFLKSCPQIGKLYYPQIDSNQLTGYGGIIFFEFTREHKDKYSDFAKALTLFGTGTGMACVTSMVAQPYTGSHASMSEEEKKEMGLGRQLVRLCFGFENPSDLKNDLEQALKSL